MAHPHLTSSPHLSTSNATVLPPRSFHLQWCNVIMQNNTKTRALKKRRRAHFEKGTQLCRSVSRRITCSIIFTEVPAGQIRLQYTRLLAMLVFPCRLRTKCPACALGYRHHRDICGFLSATYLAVPRRTQAAKDRALVALV